MNFSSPPLLLIVLVLLLLLSSGGARARARNEERFMESFHQFRTRAHGPMNGALQVGRALRRPPPKACCEKFPQIRSVHGEVVRTGGAQRSARPTLRFMESFHELRTCAHGPMNRGLLHLIRPALRALRDGEGPCGGRFMESLVGPSVPLGDTPRCWAPALSGTVSEQTKMHL